MPNVHAARHRDEEAGAGDRDAAVARYRTAAGRTMSIPERNYLIAKAGVLAARSSSP